MTRASSTKAPAPTKGLYANYFEVGHTAFEFVLDFGQHYAGKDSSCHTRIVTSPVYARALLLTLSKAVDEHAARFGAAGDEKRGDRTPGGRGGHK